MILVWLGASIVFLFLPSLGIESTDSSQQLHCSTCKISAAICDASGSPPPTYSWHIHVLFDSRRQSFAEQATRLHRDFVERFGVHEACPDNASQGDLVLSQAGVCTLPFEWDPVGPFHVAQFGFYVPLQLFSRVVPWMAHHRGSLDVLVHPNTGCPVEDHLEWSLWFLHAEADIIAGVDAGANRQTFHMQDSLNIDALRAMATSVALRPSDTSISETFESATADRSDEVVARRASAEGAEQLDGEAKLERESLKEIEEVPCSFDVEMAVSVMLLGGMVFVISLFYLVNLRDQDLRRCAWDVISATISIFVVVLCFEALNAIIKRMMIFQLAGAFKAATTYFIFFVFYGVMCTTIGWMATWEDDDEEEVQLRMTCWVTLWSHAAGFAAIDAAGTMQHLEAFIDSPMMSAVFTLVHLLILLVVFRVMDYVRTLFSLESDALERWESSSEEAENDVGALSLSFLFVQVVRFLITGALPERRGEDNEEAGAPTVRMCLTLIGVGLVFCLLAFVTAVAIHHSDHSDAGQASQMSLVNNDERLPDDREAHVHRVTKTIEHQVHQGLDPLPVYMKRWRFILTNAFAMSFAWCILFGVKGLIAFSPPVLGLPDTPASIMRTVTLALLCCVIASLVVFVIDKVADQGHAGVAAGRAFRFVMAAQGIMVGFAWELAFECGVERIVEHATEDNGANPVYLKFGIGLVVALIVIPAWRMYILRAVLDETREAFSQHKPLAQPEVVNNFVGLPTVTRVLEAPLDTPGRRSSGQRNLYQKSRGLRTL